MANEVDIGCPMHGERTPYTAPYSYIPEPGCTCPITRVREPESVAEPVTRQPREPITLFTIRRIQYDAFAEGAKAAQDADTCGCNLSVPNPYADPKPSDTPWHDYPKEG